jgi:hypothetical protein
MEPFDLNVLDALRIAATPGPWKLIDGADHWTVDGAGVDYMGFARVAFDDGSASGEYGPQCSDETRDFILGVCNAYPAMAAEIRRLRAEVEALRLVPKWVLDVGHNEECLFCGLKDRTAAAILRGEGAK